MAIIVKIVLTFFLEFAPDLKYLSVDFFLPLGQIILQILIFVPRHLPVLPFNSVELRVLLRVVAMGVLSDIVCHQQVFLPDFVVLLEEVADISHHGFEQVVDSFALMGHDLLDVFFDFGRSRHLADLLIVVKELIVDLVDHIVDLDFELVKHYFKFSLHFGELLFVGFQIFLHF